MSNPLGLLFLVALGVGIYRSERKWMTALYSLGGGILAAVAVAAYFILISGNRHSAGYAAGFTFGPVAALISLVHSRRTADHPVPPPQLG